LPGPFEGLLDALWGFLVISGDFLEVLNDF
jgi:hypothetical protein